MEKKNVSYITIDRVLEAIGLIGDEYRAKTDLCKLFATNPEYTGCENEMNEFKNSTPKLKYVRSESAVDDFYVTDNTHSKYIRQKTVDDLSSNEFLDLFRDKEVLDKLCDDTRMHPEEHPDFCECEKVIDEYRVSKRKMTGLNNKNAIVDSWEDRNNNILFGNYLQN